MRALSALSVQGFRCFAQHRLDLLPGINLVCGDNGTGKTSLIEALDVLSRRRTFRTGYVRPVIHRDASCMRLTAEFDDGLPPLTVEKLAGESAAAYAGRRRVFRQEQARIFPLRVIHADSGQTVDGPAKTRRKALDWGVFHVEHGFPRAWSDYRRALVQRNALLRRGADRAERAESADLARWDRVLAEHAAPLDAMREKHADELIKKIHRLIEPIIDDERLKPSIAYARGWAHDADLVEVLREARASDFSAGYTRHGAHRGRLEWSWPARPKFSPSGGQRKMLAAALAICQARMLQERDLPCFVALDDFTSELDEHNQDRLLEWLQTLKTTVVVTSLEAERLADACATRVRLEKAG